MSNKKSSKKKKTKKKPTVQAAAGISNNSFHTNKRLHCLLLFLLGFLLYANTIKHQFALDDAIVIYDNEYTMAGIPGIPSILGKDTFRGFFKVDGKAKLVAGGRYRPLSLVLFAIEWQFFGKSPFVGHLGNLLLYGLCGMLMYLALLQLFRGSKQREAFMIALGTTVLFLAHPIHTEVVANIKGRDEIMTLLGSLAALYYCLRAYHEGKQKFSILAGVFFFLALLSKENAITFWAVIPLAFYFFTNARLGEIFKQCLPIFIAGILFILIRTSIIGFDIGGGSTADLMNDPFQKIEDNRYVPFSASEKMATVTYTLGKYIQLLVFPHPLTHDYYPRHIDVMDWKNIKVIGSLLLYLAMIIAAMIGLKRRSRWAFPILYFLATLSIVSNIVFPIGTNMGERFMFMPSLGYCLIVAMLLYRFLGKRENIFWIAIAALFLPGAIKTIVRNGAWYDDAKIFLTDVKNSPNSAKVLNAAGGTLLSQYPAETDPTRQAEMLNEAIAHFGNAIKVHPNYKNVHLQLGNAYFYGKEYENSFRYYQNALKIDANYTEARNNLAIPYRDAGKFEGEQKGNLPKANEYLFKSLEMRGDDMETIRLLGVSHGIAGDHVNAIKYFTMRTELQPQYADAWYDLSMAYISGGNEVKADESLEKAKSLDPEIVARKQRERIK